MAATNAATPTSITSMRFVIGVISLLGLVPKLHP
jgi:hypothetical protein